MVVANSEELESKTGFSFHTTNVNLRATGRHIKVKLSLSE